MAYLASPALAFVGRHNSGKTTLLVKLIEELVGRGHDVGSVKHHGHAGFDIDIPGKDSYRHRQAGASETVISCPGQLAVIKTTPGETACSDIVARMPGHDIVLVEGFRKSGLPTVEIMRAGNEADEKAAALFHRAALEKWPLDTDFSQVGRALGRGEDMGAALAAGDPDVAGKLPRSQTVAIVSNIPTAIEAAGVFGLPVFGIDEVSLLADFVEERFVRPRITVVIQAGGESKRMGRSKATVPFAGRPLICRLIERLRTVADEMVVTTNEPENLGFIAQDYPELHVRLATDAFSHRGALPGLYTALDAASNPYVAVVACDMIFASDNLVAAEASAMTESGADVVIPFNKHGYEPFHALYRRETCLPVILEQIEQGSCRAQSFLDKVSVRKFTQDEVLSVEPFGGCFVNANTPEELRAIESTFLQG